MAAKRSVPIPRRYATAPARAMNESPVIEAIRWPI
jgi:hypothetical protein